MHGEQTVRDNWKVWQYLLEATCNTDIEEKLAACNSVHEAWGVVTEWTLPASEAEKTLLVQQLENVTMYPAEDPKTFFTRVDKLVNMMRKVGITKTEERIVHTIVRQISDEYIVQKAIIDAPLAEYPRVRVEHLVRNAYANRKVKEVMQSNSPSPAAPARSPRARCRWLSARPWEGVSGGQCSGGDPGVTSAAGATLHTFKRNRLLLQALRWALSTYGPGVGGMVTLLTSALRHPVSRATAGPVASMDTCAATALLLSVLRVPSSCQRRLRRRCFLWRQQRW